MSVARISENKSDIVKYYSSFILDNSLLSLHTQLCGLLSLLGGEKIYSWRTSQELLVVQILACSGITGSTRVRMALLNLVVEKRIN